MNDTGMPPNYLHSDNLWADDILAEIAEYVLTNKIDINSFNVILMEQLNDMFSGGCPSGRVSRLLQVLLAIKIL